MNTKKHFTTIVIAAILFTFIGAAYVFAAGSDDYDKKSVLNKTSMASDLIGMTVKSKQNEELGEVQDLIINERGRIQYVVLSQGGVLGVGDEHIPVPFNDAKIDSDKKVVTLDKIDKKMLSNAPEFTDEDWNSIGKPRFEQKVRGYYGDDFSDDYDHMKQRDKGKKESKN